MTACNTAQGRKGKWRRDSSVSGINRQSVSGRGRCRTKGDHSSHILICYHSPLMYHHPTQLFKHYLFVCWLPQLFTITARSMLNGPSVWLPFFFPPSEVGSSLQQSHDRTTPPGLVFVISWPGPVPLLCPGSTGFCSSVLTRLVLDRSLKLLFCI